MTLMFPHDDKIYRLDIRPVDHVINGHIGYRKLNNILLRKDVFDEFIHYCRQDNFVEMRKIIEHFIEFNANELSWEVRQDKELSWSM